MRNVLELLGARLSKTLVSTGFNHAEAQSNQVGATLIVTQPENGFELIGFLWSG
jgi:hypothetical protein